MLHFFLQKSRRISHTGFLHVPRSWLEDTNPPLVGIAGSVLANYRAYRCFVSAWTAKQKRRPDFLVPYGKFGWEIQQVWRVV